MSSGFSVCPTEEEAFQGREDILVVGGDVPAKVSKPSQFSQTGVHCACASYNSHVHCGPRCALALCKPARTSSSDPPWPHSTAAMIVKSERQVHFQNPQFLCVLFQILRQQDTALPLLIWFHGVRSNFTQSSKTFCL